MRINSIHIRDFKVLHDVEIEPGKINVLIGSNGSGKTTILEAIGLLSLAMTDRIDNDSLRRKGIRLSSSNLYKSSSTKRSKSQVIRMSLKWEEEQKYDYSVSLYTPSDRAEWRISSEEINLEKGGKWGRSNRSQETYDNSVGMIMMEPNEILYLVRPSAYQLRQYAIYQPSTPFLRGESDPQQAVPVGLNGGRLAESVEELLHQEGDELYFGSECIVDIHELLEWADGISVSFPNKSNVNSAVATARRVLEVHDKWMRSSDRLTAYDVSEGALYVLFLLTLALHHKSPNVFSIDNFDQAMNPRLAQKFTRKFCELILKKEKTVFLTTHNPLVLDGLDLTNDDIRLFVVERSRKTGETTIERISTTKDLMATDIPLSRMWPMGMIGGVPNI